MAKIDRNGWASGRRSLPTARWAVRMDERRRRLAGASSDHLTRQPPRGAIVASCLFSLFHSLSFILSLSFSLFHSLCFRLNRRSTKNLHRISAESGRIHLHLSAADRSIVRNPGISASPHPPSLKFPRITPASCRASFLESLGRMETAQKGMRG